jgi:hypothetical protein
MLYNMTTTTMVTFKIDERERAKETFQEMMDLHIHREETQHGHQCPLNRQDAAKQRRLNIPRHNNDLMASRRHAERSAKKSLPTCEETATQTCEKNEHSDECQRKLHSFWKSRTKVRMA